MAWQKCVTVSLFCAPSYRLPRALSLVLAFASVGAVRGAANKFLFAVIAGWTILSVLTHLSVLQELSNKAPFTMSKSLTYLRFDCGARLPASGYIKAGHEWGTNAKYVHEKQNGPPPRKDGRYRCVVFDMNGGISVPKLEDGRSAPCLSCPCRRSAGTKELRCMPEDPRHGWRFMVVCYPRELTADDEDSGADIAGRMESTLTPKQQEVFIWIKGFMVQNEMPPTVREIAKRFGMKSSSAFYFLQVLEKKGFLLRGPLGARSLVLTKSAI